MRRAGQAAPLTVDTSDVLPVEIDASLPDGTLIDLNCDGGGGEWGKARPPPQVVLAQCVGGSTSWPYDVCRPKA